VDVLQATTLGSAPTEQPLLLERVTA
jgi:hypothetical protein